MSLVISKVFTYDTDAGNYIQAVEGPAGDNQALEPAVRQAINNFVVGCKQDGIWSAIKASCILAGARTTNGALIPLTGAAPTPYNFDLVTDTDYNRKTGLKGNTSNKSLDSNRNRQQDPQDNAHISAYITEPISLSNDYYFGAFAGGTGGAALVTDAAGGVGGWLNNGSINIFTNTYSVSGLAGLSRSSPSAYNARLQQRTSSYSTASQPPPNTKLVFFATNQNTAGQFAAVGHSNARLAFYSIGESLDLAKLDSRVTDLINAFGAAIP